MDDPDLERALADALQAHQAGDLDRASAGYDAVIKIDPTNGRALFLRGTLCLQRGDNERAANLLQQAAAVRQDDAAVRNNYGLALLNLGRIDQAVEAFRSATRLGPRGADGWSNLGNALRRRQSYTEAIDAYRRAVALAPDRPGLHSALGVALGHQGRFDDALESHRQAIKLAPKKADYRNNLALTLRQAGREEDAERALRIAIEFSPEGAEYHAALGNLLRRAGRTEEAVAALRAARERGSEVPDLERRLQLLANYVDRTADVALADALAAAARIKSGITPYSTFDNIPAPERALRIGLVSADLRQHPVGRFLTSPLAYLDQSRYQLFAYSGREVADAVSDRLRSIVPNWRPTTGMSDQALAEAIRADQIDVLLDLGGPTSGDRLGVFARRPAPVAASYLGYFATTGLDTIDYVLANRFLIPDAERSQWLELPWHLPGTHLCFEVIGVTPGVTPPPCAKRGVFTFGSFNNTAKLTGKTLDAWGEILKRARSSRLVLRGPVANPLAEQEVLKQFEARGVARERIVVEPFRHRYYEHLAGYSEVDLALDPFPYNGGTTTVEALYMGVPVLTVVGASYVSHMGESILRSAGLDEWVAPDTTAYVAKAIDIASRAPDLIEIRRNLRQHILASPLFDGRSFARNLEDAFRGMWHAWCETQAER